MAFPSISDDSLFPATSLPYGIGSPTGSDPRPVVAAGDHAVDLRAFERTGGLTGLGLTPGTFDRHSLNAFLAHDRTVWSAVRARLSDVVAGRVSIGDGAVLPREALAMGLPVEVGDYVDFYSCLHHATNLGRLFRPDSEPLLPNWKQLPVGYHGRAGTIVPDGSDIPRPCGLRSSEGTVNHGPSRALDIELELGFVIGGASERGRPIPVNQAAQHIFGVCLINDWSARDIQSFEYVPLGPFLGKSFATSMSPWLLPLEAIDAYRMPSVEQVPPVAEYLQVEGDWGLDLHFEVVIETAAMRSAGTTPAVISTTGFDMYWTPPQQLAHLTANGASTRPGDLFASGTISGPTRGTEGSFIELTENGRSPITLPDGSTRAFLEDGDTVTLRGWAGSGSGRIGLGSVSGPIRGVTP